MKLITIGRRTKKSKTIKINQNADASARVQYAHTHRFLCALMDFWCQFAELQDLVTKSKQERVRAW